MDTLDEEILNLWKLLYENKVEYIMVGGFATNLHGFQRTTADMDIWIKDSLENRKHLRKAFKELGLGDFEQIENMKFVPGWSGLRLNSGFELDIMTYIQGFEQENFDECYKIAPTALIMEIPVKFLHLNQLIEAKKTSAREKDKIDIIELEKIRNKKGDS